MNIHDVDVGIIFAANSEADKLNSTIKNSTIQDVNPSFAPTT